MTEPARRAAVALEELDAVTRRLRRDCPWDRAQDERSIVPHTVEEAYELADAAASGDDRKLLDELGDVLFQVLFLAMLMEERGAGSLAAAADHCRRKLIRRHPHVYSDVEVADTDEVIRNWDRIKREEQRPESGAFGELPGNLPALLYARKVAQRAQAVLAQDQGSDSERLEEALAAVAERAEGAAAPLSGPEGFEAVGNLLFSVVEVARRLQVEPELALRAAADRRRIEAEQRAAAKETGAAAR